MAEHRKSDQSRVYLCDGGLRKRASKLNCHLVIRWIEYHAIATPSAITQYGMIPAWDPPDSAIPSTVSNMPINAHVPHKKTRYWLRLVRCISVCVFEPSDVLQPFFRRKSRQFEWLSRWRHKLLSLAIGY
jgi:hypothetical protein